eukprot:Colp12_sorted_trinity150504_noHs@27709
MPTVLHEVNAPVASMKATHGRLRHYESSRPIMRDQQEAGNGLPELNKLEDFAEILRSSTRTDPWADLSPAWSDYELFKTLVVGVFILPIRALLVVFTLVLWSLLSNIAVLGIPQRELQVQPIGPLRRLLVRVANVCPRVVMFIAGFWYVKERYVDLEGREISKTQYETLLAGHRRVPIIVSNHVSFFECLYFFYTHACSMVVNSSVKSLPFIPDALAALQCVFVDRELPQSRQAVRDVLLNRAQTDGFPPMLVFPEGTTTNGVSVLQFRKGAFEPGLPVQCMVVRPVFRNFSWAWANQSLFTVVLRSLCQFSNLMEVTCTPPYSPSLD